MRLNDDDNDTPLKVVAQQVKEAVNGQIEALFKPLKWFREHDVQIEVRMTNHELTVIGRTPEGTTLFRVDKGNNPNN